MSYLQKSALTLAEASNGNPIISTIVVALFYLAFNQFEAMIEILLFGERFVHWLDPLFATSAISYSAYAVWWCAIFNGSKGK